jgi:hypothetical protein
MRLDRGIVALLTVLMVTMASAGAGYAQGTTSRVTGQVADTSGGRIPGATVTLTNDATGIAFVTVTNDTGTYLFDAVQVGRYTVAVELQGFKRFVSSDNIVTIGDPTTVNAVLETGGLEETIEVRASSELVQISTSGNMGSTFDQRTIESLPLVGARGRNPLSFVMTQPGVVSGSNTGGNVHVHGARDRSWNFTLDGIDTNESSAGGSNFSPLRTNPDALAEFKVLTGNTTAEYGRNSGGQVAMITRSGSNRFSGNLFYFDRRTGYNANEWENNIDGREKRKFDQQMPGFSLGGPIKRNQTFFFVNTQWLAAQQTRSITRTVYTAEARQGLMRYHTAGRNLPFGVANASVDVNGNPLVPFATYNVAARDPQQRGLDPTILRLIAEMPLPNNFLVGDGLNTAGYTWSPPEEEEQVDFVTKIDHNFNARHTAFVRFSKGYQNTICDSVNAGESFFPGQPCLVNTNRSPYNWAANWRWAPRGTLVNELVVGQNHFTFDFINPSADPSQPTLLGPVTVPERFTVGNLRTIDTYQVVNNLSLSRGAHSYRFGTNMRFQRHRDIRGSVAGFNIAPQVNFATGINTVDPATFGIPGTVNTQFDRPALQSHINFLLGRVGQISQGFVQRGNTYAPGGTPFNFLSTYPELDFYVQDTWKPRSNLTIDAGLRYEVKLPPGNPDGLIRRPNQSLAVGQGPSRTLEWVQGDLFSTDWSNFGPSTGFAWDPGGEGRSVIRGNYRLAYDRLNTFLLSSAVFQSIPGITTGVVNQAFGQAGGRLRDGLPALQPTVTPADFLQPPAVGTGSTTVVDPDMRTPRTHGWVLSYQKAILRNSLFEIAYVGRRASNLYGAYNVHQVEIRDNGFLDAFKIVQAGGESPLMNQLVGPDSRRQANESGSAMIRRLFAATLQNNAAASLAASLGTRVQGGRTLADLSGLGHHFFYPYTQFLGGVNVIDSGDYSRYNALQMKLERRFADGYSYLFGYTLSRSKDTRSFDPAFTVVATGNAQSASSTPFDIHNRDLNYALSDFDRTHVLQAQGVWELPFGQGRRYGGGVGRAADALIGGWTLSTQWIARSGRPMTVYSGANTLSNVVQTPANCSGCSPKFGSIHDEDGLAWYFRPDERAKFSQPGPGEFGNTGRNFFRGPGDFKNINMSFAKRTPIVGRQILEIRADATNVLNSPTWGFPTLTSTSALFGRNRVPLSGNSRKFMLGVKYYF